MSAGRWMGTDWVKLCPRRSASADPLNTPSCGSERVVRFRACAGCSIIDTRVRGSASTCFSCSHSTIASRTLHRRSHRAPALGAVTTMRTRTNPPVASVICSDDAR